MYYMCYMLRSHFIKILELFQHVLHDGLEGKLAKYIYQRGLNWTVASVNEWVRWFYTIWSKPVSLVINKRQLGKDRFFIAQMLMSYTCTGRGVLRLKISRHGVTQNWCKSLRSGLANTLHNLIPTFGGLQFPSLTCFWKWTSKLPTLTSVVHIVTII